MTALLESGSHTRAHTSAKSSGIRRHRWKALGTACEIQFTCEDDELARAFIANSVAWVERFEARYSRFRPNSLVSRINAAAGLDWVETDADADQLLGFCASLHRLTAGTVDVTAAPLMRLWDYRGAAPRVPNETEIAAALNLVGWEKIRHEPGRVLLPRRGMALDFGGWGKEYAVDAVAALAHSHGINRALIDFGRDIMAVGAAPEKPAWHVGLENHRDPAGPCRGSIAARDVGVATSGDYMRGFEAGGRRYGHIVDARTGRPVENGCRQVTVVAPSCLLAGAFSTALFILGPEQGLRFASDMMHVEARILTDQAQHQTRGFFRYVVS